MNMPVRNYEPGVSRELHNLNYCVKPFIGKLILV